MTEVRFLRPGQQTQAHMCNLETLHALIKVVSCSDLESEGEKNTKITNDCLKLITQLTSQQLPWQKKGGGRRGNSSPPTKSTESPLHDLYGLEPSS